LSFPTRRATDKIDIRTPDARPVADPETKWWGWGAEGREFNIESRPASWSAIRGALSLSGDERWPRPEFQEIPLQPSRMAQADRAALEGILGEGGISTDHRDRLSHALGKSYLDLIRLRLRRIPIPPDGVALPRSGDEIRRVLEFAADRQYAIIPYGGGTSVVGGIEPTDPRPHIVLDLRRLNRLLAVDERSMLATAEAGILGPDLERALGARGLTAGHWPQSFEFSTLGGWFAARGVGAWSNKYGKAEHIVVGATLVAPQATLRVGAFPASATGPDLLGLVAGSEGTLGVIIEATIKVHPAPEVQVFDTYLFKSFGEGLDALRTLAQAGDAPPLAYLSDEEETRFGASAQWASGSRRRPPQGAAAFVAGFQGSLADVRRLRSACRRSSAGAVPIRTSDGTSWFRERHERPYVRDSLIDHRVLIDSLETATTWANAERLHGAITTAIRDALASSGSPSLVMCHAAHTYHHGCSLYVTFLARQAIGREVEQWQTVKAAAMRALLDNGGVVSHHHGIGVDHAPYAREALGDAAVAALRALKSALDPANIMNPGKLVPP